MQFSPFFNLPFFCTFSFSFQPLIITIVFFIIYNTTLHSSHCNTNSQFYFYRNHFPRTVFWRWRTRRRPRPPPTGSWTGSPEAPTRWVLLLFASYWSLLNFRMSIVAFPPKLSTFYITLFQKHFFFLLLIYFERGGKESGLEGFLKEIGFKNWEKNCVKWGIRSEIKKEFKIKETYI